MNSAKVLNLFKLVILSAILSLAGNNVYAQRTTPLSEAKPVPSATPTLEKEFFRNILRDQKAIWTSPAQVRGRDAAWLVPLGLATTALIATDRETGDAMATFHDQVAASRTISYAGSTYFLGGVAAGFYLIGRSKNNYRARETGVLSAEALVDSLIIAAALKGITERARPRSGSERSKFFVGGTSFPSGHSIQVWSVATVIANEYHDRLAVQIAAYGVAGAVSAARFTGLKHYLSDVVVGSALGYGIGRYVYKKHHRKARGSVESEEEESLSSSRWPAIMPKYDRRARTYGLALAWSF